MRNLILGLAALCCNPAFSQVDSNVSRSVNNLIEYNKNNVSEKVFLHFDRTVYTSGEIVWLKSYLVDGSFHLPSTFSEIVYVELIDDNNNIIAKRNLKMSEGVGLGDIRIPKDLASGIYGLKAYTHYMKNEGSDTFFTEKITIINTSKMAIEDIEKIDSINVASLFNSTIESSNSEIATNISFYTEGGQLVDGLESIIAFQITNHLGNPVDNVRGKIVNSKGDSITSFESSHAGRGSFTLKPENSEKYFAESNLFAKKQLPGALEEGFVMQVRQNEKRVYVTVKNNQDQSMKDSYLIGHVRGIVFNATLISEDQTYLFATILKESIPAGVASFTFFDSKGLPKAERLIFIDNETNTQTLVTKLSGEEFTENQQISIKASLNDAESNPVNMTGSFSAIDSKSISKNRNSNIKTYLLLESCLEKKINEVTSYFDAENTALDTPIDHLLMTEELRKYQWADIESSIKPEIQFYPQKGLSIKGRLLNFQDKKTPVQGEVKLTLLSSSPVEETITTGENGEFEFLGWDIRDSAKFILQANPLESDKKGKKNKILITLDDLEQKNVTQSPSSAFMKKIPLSDDAKNIIRKSKKIEAYRAVLLANEKLKQPKNTLAKREDDPYYRPTQIYERPDERIILDSIPFASNAFNVFDVVRTKVPGIMIYGNAPDQQVSFKRGAILSGNSCMILLDGTVIRHSRAFSLPPVNVSHIDILLDDNALATFGPNAGGGVIAIYTRKATERLISSITEGFLSFTHPGYSKPKEFPKQAIISSSQENWKPDFRNTLFWSPLVIKEDGEKQITFTSSDEKSDYIIQIQGISELGIPIYRELKFSVK